MNQVFSLETLQCLVAFFDEENNEADCIPVVRNEIEVTVMEEVDQYCKDRDTCSHMLLSLLHKPTGRQEKQ